MKYNVNDLIYLCNYIDSYASFRFDIELLLQRKTLKEALFVGRESQTKHFDYKNKRVQVLCQKYGNMAEMVLCSATNKDVMTKLRKFDYIYEYILSNINELNNIKDLLVKLKKLGFDDIIFDVYMNITYDKYNISIDYTKNRCITYLDNIMVLPNSSEDVITYRSNKSDYKIELMTSSRYDNTVILRGKIIYLTSLVFDKDRLPDNLDLNDIYSKIVTLAHYKEKTLTKKKTI